MDRLAIIALAIVIAGLLSGGVYSVSSSGLSTAIIINRFTGAAWSCSVVCELIETRRNSK